MKFKMTYVFSMILAIFSIGLSFWCGFDQGVKHGGALNSISFAHISTAQIRRLSTGSQEDTDNVIGLFNIYIDHGLDQFVWYTESGSDLVGSLLMSDYEKTLEKSVRVIAKYRKNDPQIQNYDFIKNPEVKEANIKMAKERNYVVKKYTNE